MRNQSSRFLALAGVASFVFASACGRSHGDNGIATSIEPAEECEGYAADYERCLRGLAPDPATAESLADNTRLSLRAAVVDEASRNRLNDQCRTARTQLRRSCQ
jgi:hypothetical protein